MYASRALVLRPVSSVTHATQGTCVKFDAITHASHATQAKFLRNYLEWSVGLLLGFGKYPIFSFYF